MSDDFDSIVRDQVLEERARSDSALGFHRAGAGPGAEPIFGHVPPGPRTESPPESTDFVSAMFHRL